MKTPSPILKWAGGKGRLLEQYAPHFLQLPFKRYFEPFVGGGAVYFWLFGQRGPFPACLSDSNPELINCYGVVKSRCQALIARLTQLQAQHSAEFYYQMRATQPEDPLEQAARLIYLNKTCYNGLYRVNSKGQFNVPLGKYVRPNVLQEERLQLASRALQQVELVCQSFDKVKRRARAGDLVYFDPPYQPLSRTASFTSYTRDDFQEEKQYALSRLFAELVERGCFVLLSNSDTPLMREFYKDYQVIEVSAPRFINSRADRRQAIGEILVVGHSTGSP